MGLGLFIAKTLLERSGAELRFANGPEISLPNEALPSKVGAIVQVIWPRDAVDARRGSNAVPVGPNQHITN
jgi:two-component system sensor histidine kinase RegB